MSKDKVVDIAALREKRTALGAAEWNQTLLTVLELLVLLEARIQKLDAAVFPKLGEQS